MTRWRKGRLEDLDLTGRRFGRLVAVERVPPAVALRAYTQATRASLSSRREPCA
jgi:hypothetical protein